MNFRQPLVRMHPLYSAWDGMKRRCHGSKSTARYGGRGIYVCDRWLFGEGSKTGFECFVMDMGDRPSLAHTIDRKDNDGPYSPENCRWATEVEQQSNRSNNRIVRFHDRDMTLAAAVRLSGLKEATVYGRLKLGWSVDAALTKPVRRA